MPDGLRLTREGDRDLFVNTGLGEFLELLEMGWRVRNCRCLGRSLLLPQDRDVKRVACKVAWFLHSWYADLYLG
jgi:hypothetical protein